MQSPAAKEPSTRLGEQQSYWLAASLSFEYCSLVVVHYFQALTLALALAGVRAWARRYS